MTKFSKVVFKSLFGMVLLCLAFSCVSFGVYQSRADVYALNGGAIYLEENATYNMKGGRIRGSVGELGGAVYVSGNATFNMTGGTITGCSANDGGAVYVANGGIANINGGTIEDCEATNGSGVYVANGGTLNVYSGTISNDVYMAGSMVYSGGLVSGNIKLTGSEQLTINAVPSTSLKITTSLTDVGTKLAKINASNFTTNNVVVSGLKTGTRVVVSNGYLVIDHIYFTVTINVNTAGYGTVSKTSVAVPYGSSISTNGNVLTIGSNTITATETTDTAQYDYSFSSWTNASGTITSDKTITANFTRSVRSYTITWKNDDGTILETDTDVLYGATPTYDGSTPTKTATAQYTYTFSGWSPSIASVSGAQTYTAQYTATTRKYTITIQANNSSYGTVSSTSVSVSSGSSVKVDSSSANVLNVGGTLVTATPATGVSYTYGFTSWTQTSTSGTKITTSGITVTSDITIYANFYREAIETYYTVHIQTGDFAGEYYIENTDSSEYIEGNSFSVLARSQIYVSGDYLFVGEYVIVATAYNTAYVASWEYSGDIVDSNNYYIYLTMVLGEEYYEVTIDNYYDDTQTTIYVGYGTWFRIYRDGYRFEVDVVDGYTIYQAEHPIDSSGALLCTYYFGGYEVEHPTDTGGLGDGDYIELEVDGDVTLMIQVN